MASSTFLLLTSDPPDNFFPFTCSYNVVTLAFRPFENSELQGSYRLHNNYEAFANMHGFMDFYLYGIQVLLWFAGGVCHMSGHGRWHNHVVTSDQDRPQISESRNYELPLLVESTKDAGEGPDSKKCTFNHQGCKDCREDNAACPDAQTADKKSTDPNFSTSYISILNM